MLRLGPPYYNIEGVFLMGDAHDENQIYYFPNSPHVPIDDQGRPIIRLITLKEAQDEVDPGDEDLTSFLFFDTVLSWPEETLKKVKKEIEDMLEEERGVRPEIRLGPLPFRRGGVQLQFLDEITREIVLDPPEPEPGTPPPATPPEPVIEEVPDWVSYLTTSGVPSLYGDNRAVFQAELTRKATKLVNGAFDGVIPASVFYTLEYVGQMEAYNVRVTADWNQVYEFVQEKTGVKFLIFSSEVDDITTEMIDTKVINVEAALDTTETDIDPDDLEKQFEDVKKDLLDFVMETFFEPVANPNAANPDHQNESLSTLESLARLAHMQHGVAIGYSRREISAEELRSIEIDYTVKRAVTRKIYPQAHIHVFFEDLGVTRDDIVTVVDGSDDMWSTAEFTASCVGDFAGGGIDRVVLDVQYVKDTDFADDPEALIDPDDPDDPIRNRLWSFTFKDGTEVFRKSTWFDEEIGPKFFYRYRVFFRPDAVPGPASSHETTWKVETSKDIVVDTGQIFETQTVTIEAAENFPWERYPQTLLKLRYDDPVSSWTHEDAKALTKDSPDYISTFRQRVNDGIEPEFSLIHIRSDNKLIETGWQKVTRGINLIYNPDPKELEVKFVVSPATPKGLLFVDLLYEDPENGIHESNALIFSDDTFYRPQTWKIPWKDPSKRRFKMSQSIVGDTEVVQTGFVEVEGRTVILGNIFARSMEVQPKLIGPDFTSQGVEKAILKLKYEDAANGVLNEKLHEFGGPGDAPTWKVLLKAPSLRDYSYELTFLMNDGFTRSAGEQTSRERFLILSSEVPA